MTNVDLHDIYCRAAAAIAEAQAILITAGAGIGVDSGLPDFRGNEGFWNAYPPFRKLGMSFVDMANPRWFDKDPEQAWGFYGHRMNLYRDTQPHAGFKILRRWAENAPEGFFVFTSNVDGYFQRAGFAADCVVECHGSIRHLQCTQPCCRRIHAANDMDVVVDPETFRAAPPLPACPCCRSMARPNILMFGDGCWLDDRTNEQHQRYQQWRRELQGQLLVIECGAGTAVPTIRMESEWRADRLIRINPRESQVPDGQLSVPCGTLEAVSKIDALLQ